MRSLRQRHTARRIHRRILTEFPDATVAELTVRNHVHERNRQMGLFRRETFVPQSYSWAQEAQVDWYEAWVDLGEERTKVQMFVLAWRQIRDGAIRRRCEQSLCRRQPFSSAPSRLPRRARARIELDQPDSPVAPSASSADPDRLYR